jgi:hypothetical protein
LRSGSHFRDELTVKVTFAEVQALGESRDAFAIHHAVADQAHRSADDVGPDVPFRRTRRRVGAATFACPEPGDLGRGRGWEEANVRALGSDRRTARAAIDAGRGDAGEEPPVETGVAAGDGSIATFEVLDHEVIIHRGVG